MYIFIVIVFLWTPLIENQILRYVVYKPYLLLLLLLLKVGETLRHEYRSQTKNQDQRCFMVVKHGHLLHIWWRRSNQQICDCTDVCYTYHRKENHKLRSSKKSVIWYNAAQGNCKEADKILLNYREERRKIGYSNVWIRERIDGTR